MSLITKRYDYQPIERKQVEGRRLYATPDGNAVASVTTILDATKDKTHLIAWKKRVGEQKAQEIVTEAAGVGTRMHKYLEDYIDTGKWPEPGSNPYAQLAIEIANSTDYGLVSGVFTADLDRANRAAQKLRAGQVFVNEWYAGGVETPFGGYGKSGYGREKGREALWNYVQTKNIAMKIGK